MAPRWGVLLIVTLSGCAAEAPAPPSSRPAAPAAAEERALDPKVFEETEALSRDGQVRVRAVEGWAIHTHGGDPAELSSARFVVTSERPLRLSVERVDYLWAVGKEPVDVHSSPRVLSLGTGKSPSDPGPLDLPAGEQEVTVTFEPVEAYATWNERFGFRLTLALDGSEKLVVVAETKVEREEPEPDLPMDDE